MHNMSGTNVHVQYIHVCMYSTCTVHTCVYVQYMYGTCMCVCTVHVHVHVHENTCVQHTTYNILHIHVAKVVTEEEKKGRKPRPNKLHHKAQTNTAQKEYK